MKRIGNLFDAVVEPENLRLAFWKASRGKQHRPDQRKYAARLEEEIEGLRLGLLQGDYPAGDYTRFTVYDPKERVICAAAFRERVLHHALINVCEPLVDGWLMFDCYACRVGKGQAKAVRRAQAFAGRYEWFLKADIRKFFEQQQQRVPCRLPLSTAETLEECMGSPPVSCFRGRNKERMAA